MRFDTMLKIGTHAAKLFQHDSFQEMTKMIHKGVKRRSADPGHWMNTPQLPYSQDRFTRHHNQFGPLPPYGNGNRAAGGNGAASNPPQSQAGGVPWKDLLTPNNLQMVGQLGQLLKGFTDRGNNNQK